MFPRAWLSFSTDPLWLWVSMGLLSYNTSTEISPGHTGFTGDKVITHSVYQKSQMLMPTEIKGTG